MKQFFLNLLNSESPISSKRFVGTIALFSCIAFAIVATIKNGGIIPEFCYNGLLIFSGGAFCITGIENVLKTPTAPVVEPAVEEQKITE